jgi:hypothetical protein
MSIASMFGPWNVGFCLCVAAASIGSVTAGQVVIDAVHKGHAVGHEQDGVVAVSDALRDGGDVNERDRSGWTPLMHAALECRPAIVKHLLDLGADLGIRASAERKTSFMDHGQTALSIGAACFIARRRALIAPGRGMPPSYVQSELNAARDIVRQLVQKGAKVNLADADGRTPLMMAVMHGWAAAVEELLFAKADATASDHDGRTVLDYADPADLDILKALRKAGAPPPSGRSGRTVCDAERALDKAGYNTPIIDCDAGPQLKAVIVRFQNEHELSATGELDADARKALKIR